MMNMKALWVLVLLLAAPLIARAASPQDAAAPAASPAGGLSELELRIWNDPAFQRQFVDSYIAETDIEPKVTVVEREQMEKVLAAMSSDNLDKAVKLLEKNRGEAASAVFDFTLANIHFQREQYNEAVADYRIAVEKYPKFRRAWRNMGLIYVRQEQFGDAVSAFTRVIELGGGDAITYGLLGFAYSNLANDLSAETAYRMAVLLDPKTVDWKMGLARSFFNQERYADAVALCNLLIAEDPGRADMWLLQANAYIGMNQPLKAAENYEFVDNLGKSTADSLNMLGDIYVNEQLFELAVSSYIRAMDKDEHGTPARAVRAAKVMVARGALHETQKLVEHIEQRFGDQLSTEDRKDLLKLQVRMAVAEGAGDQEVRALEQIVALDPLDGEALILLGQHSARAGDAEQAIFYYERAAGIEGYEADAKVRQAQLLVSQTKYAEALPLLRRAQELKPRDNVRKYLDQVEALAKTR
jgi:tetratricopeptide (TPR) repeat protein